MNLLSLNIYEGKYSEFLEIITNPHKPTLVFTPNPEMLVKASKDAGFLEILRKAEYLVPDANGLYTASLIMEGRSFFFALLSTLCKKKKLKEQYGELIRGSSLTEDLVYFAIEKQERILMIDNYRIIHPKNSFEIKKMEVQSHLRTVFTKKFPNLQIEILFDGETSPKEIASLIEKNDIRYVFSCIGMKQQEERLSEIFSFLALSQKVVGLGVGSSFDYLLGLQKRAPILFQKLGLEWLYRLLLSPIERWRRIKVALIDFPKMFIK